MSLSLFKEIKKIDTAIYKQKTSLHNNNKIILLKINKYLYHPLTWLSIGSLSYFYLYRSRYLLKALGQAKPVLNVIKNLLLFKKLFLNNIKQSLLHG